MWYFITFVLGCLTGSVLGVVIFALITTSSRSERQIEAIQRTNGQIRDSNDRLIDLD